MAMEFSEAILSKEGKVFATVNGKTKEIAELVKLEAKIEITTTEVKVVGRRMVGEKAAGAKGTGSVKLHYKQDMLRDVASEYIKTGKYPTIDIQAINDDPSVPGKRVVHNLRGCIFKGALLNLIDGDTDDAVAEEADFSFNDYQKM